MKIVVIGGSGLIGSKLVNKPREDGHDALAAAPETGVDTLTGEGLAEALEGAQVVVDVANAPVWDDAAVLDFFRTSSRNLLTAEQAAGVSHHVALSVVGADRLPESGYLGPTPPVDGVGFERPRLRRATCPQPRASSPASTSSRCPRTTLRRLATSTRISRSRRVKALGQHAGPGIRDREPDHRGDGVR